MQMRLLIISFAIAIVIELSNAKLLFVYEHFRHGARQPLEEIENNKDYFNFTWNNIGELTAVGERMHYLLGLRNQIRYHNFLSDHFDPREILVMSTNYNRTIQSALAHLQGMFTPSNITQLTEVQKEARPPNKPSSEIEEKITQEIGNLAFNPLKHNIDLVPLHIFFKSEKFYLLYEPYNSSGCIPVDDMRIINGQHQNISQITKEFDDEFGKVFRKVFHKAEDEEFTFPFLLTLCDHFIADLYDGKNMKDTNLKIEFTKFENICVRILDLHNLKIVFGDDKRNLVKIGMSPAINQILNYMEETVKLDKKNQSDALSSNALKFLIHSAHDSSMTGMQMFLQIAFDTKMYYPRYASNLFFELHRNESDYFVLYFYEDELIKTIPYPEFKKKLIDLVVNSTEIIDFCRTPVFKSAELSKKYLLIAVTVFLAVICALIIGAIIYIFVLVKYSKNQQEPLTMDSNTPILN